MTDAPKSLPNRVVMPPETICEDGHHIGYWKYVRGTLQSLAPEVTVEFRDDVGRIGWSSFEILVDDELAVIDYSDFHHVDPQYRRYDHWFRFHHTPAFVPYPNLGSFPPWSFLDWNEYERVTASKSYTASSDAIIYRHSRLENRLPNLVQRRTHAMTLLTQHCGERLRTGYVPQHKYFEECLDCLAVVHIPGSHPHTLDRTVQQMFALGVCVISPDLWTTCLEQRPQAGVHYDAIQDDYSDLPEIVDWVTQHRSQAVEIGVAAQQFFRSHCTPHAIWTYIHRHITEPQTTML